MELNIDAYRQLPARVLPYDTVYQEIKSHLSTKYANVLAESVENESEKETVMQLITKYLKDTVIQVESQTLEQLVNRLYNDMSQFGIITDPVQDENNEEINCNAYNDIEVVTPDGYKKLDTTYSSPEQIQDYAKKIMRIGGVTLDESEPIGDGYISTGVRASAIRTPCVDEDVGAVLFIRRQRMADITREDYLKSDTATPDELDLIQSLINYGVSVVFAGAVGSGKTTDMNFFLRQVPVEKGMFVIEDTRELNLVRRDTQGRIISRVIHTKTRFSDEEKKNITMDKLLRVGLRSNKQYIIPSEMRGPEAMTAQEAARTGQTVVTSLHSKNARAAYPRILTMCNMSGTRINDQLLLSMIVEAFPVIVYKKRLPDRSRRIMEVFEATGVQDGHVTGHTLYRFRVTDNRYHADGSASVIGQHEKVEPISDELAQTLLEGGAPLSLVQRFASIKQKGGDPF